MSERPSELIRKMFGMLDGKDLGQLLRSRKYHQIEPPCKIDTYLKCHSYPIYVTITVYGSQQLAES